MSERMTPFYCPYCGEESLEPGGEAPGAWFCPDCLRSFSLKFLGVGTPRTASKENPR
ncbi:Insertion element protein [Spirillospora sp. NPDC049024]|uniref:Insertion element protein n=1 Tax=unclassified Actinomadura TaxID=2626254 RepID=UPI0011EEA0AC|nr:Insertion element protein [Actinomadura sp. K4S16]